MTARKAWAAAMPAVAKLRTDLRAESPIDEERARRLLSDALAEMGNGAALLTVSANIETAAGNEDVAGSIAAYVRTVKRSAELSTLVQVLDHLRVDNELDRQQRLLDVVMSLGRSTAVPAYVDDLVDRLHEAGLTSLAKRGITPDQLAALEEVFGGPKVDKPARSAPKSRVRLLPAGQTPWAVIANPINGYTFETRVLQSGHERDEVIRHAGLPPMASLDDYRPGALVEMANRTDDRSKALFIHSELNKWIFAQGFNDPKLKDQRGTAWTFMLAYAHGCLSPAAGFPKVEFASPWNVNQIVTAQRTP